MFILKKIWKRWVKIAHVIGVFQSKLILTIFYFLILSPAGIIFTLFKDGLGLKKSPKSKWVLKDKQAQTIEELKEQY